MKLPSVFGMKAKSQRKLRVLLEAVSPLALWIYPITVLLVTILSLFLLINAFDIVTFISIC